MKSYLVKRLLLAIPTLIGITIITFCIIQLAPGNPVERNQQLEQGIKSEEITKEIIEQTKKLYGLDKPIHIQYLIWLKRIATFDFGDSYKDHRPVLDKIKERLPITLTLNLISIFLVYIIAVPIGIMSAIKDRSIMDRITTFLLFGLYSIPSFWLAMMLIYFLGGGEHWDIFPIYGIHSANYDSFSFFKKTTDFLWHITLPIICLTYADFASLSRYQKGSLLEVLRENYVRTARSKGLSEKSVILKHVLRNSLIPIITIVSAILPAMIGGSVIIESIFSIPGIGQLGFEAILSRDYPLIMAITTITAFLTLIGILIADILYVLVDPRITFEGKN